MFVRSVKFVVIVVSVIVVQFCAIVLIPVAFFFWWVTWLGQLCGPYVWRVCSVWDVCGLIVFFLDGIVVDVCVSTLKSRACLILSTLRRF